MLKAVTVIVTDAVRLQSRRTLHHFHITSPVATKSSASVLRERPVYKVCQQRIDSGHSESCASLNLYRFYSKKHKGGKGGEKKTAQKNVTLSEDEMNSVINVEKMKEEMEAVIAGLRNEFVQHIHVHITTGTFNTLPIVTDDGKFPLNQLGHILQKNPNLIQINMASAPQYIKPVMTAILESGIGVNPQQDKGSIFIQLPIATREQREKLAQSTKVLCNKAKERLREVHNKYNKKLKHSQAQHSEDLVHNVQTLVYNHMASCSSDLDTITQLKQDELLQKK